MLKFWKNEDRKLYFSRQICRTYELQSIFLEGNAKAITKNLSIIVVEAWYVPGLQVFEEKFFQLVEMPR